MFASFFRFLLELIANFVGVILSPIDSILSVAFPSVNDYINSLNTLMANIFSRITPYIHWINHLIPPSTFSAIKVYIATTIVIYTISIALHSIFKIFTIIQNIKFW